MILSRRSVLFGLIAAPIVVRAGIIMPVRPLRDVTEHPFGTMRVYGKDCFGRDIVETILPRHYNKELFGFITSVEYVGAEPVKDHPCVGVEGNFTAINMRRA
jgi:hypothetical protein